MKTNSKFMIGNKYRLGKKGQKLSNATRSLMSKSKKGIKWKDTKRTYIPENHGMWKGGSMPFKNKQAMIRDNFTCQICGITDKEVLMVDHIVPKSVRKDLKLELNNLITLCANCHIKKTRTEFRNKTYKNKHEQELS